MVRSIYFDKVELNIMHETLTDVLNDKDKRLSTSDDYLLRKCIKKIGDNL